MLLSGDLLPWALFMALIFALLAIDLGVFNRKAHAPTRREALAWTVVWIGVALLFNLGVYATRGAEDGLEWTTGYLIEKSLSIDNVFVFLLIFSSFGVPVAYQHRVLFWGILGALVMRGALILVGSALLDEFNWIIYLFGGLLIFTGLRFLRDTEHEPDLTNSRVLKVTRRLFRTTHEYDGAKLFTRQNGLLYATPLFIVLVVVESSDLVFAVDSIPAIFAVTRDPFIVFTSNVFAILGLRALYFVLGGYLSGLAYLKPALAAVLVFVGAKMLLSDVFHLHPLVSLAVILVILTVAITASLFVKPDPPIVPALDTDAPPPVAPEPDEEAAVPRH